MNDDMKNKNSEGLDLENNIDFNPLNTELEKLEKKDFNSIKSKIENAELNPNNSTEENSEKPIKKKSRMIKIWVPAVAAILVVLLGVAGIAVNLGYLSLPTSSSVGTSDEDTSQNPREYEELYSKMRGTVLRRASERRLFNSIVYEEMEIASEEDAGLAGSAPGSEKSLALSASAGFSLDAGGGEKSYGETNVQVDGVDEPDIVKNDGVNLYTLSTIYANTDDGYTDFIDLLTITRLEDMQIINQEAFHASNGDSYASMQTRNLSDMYVKNGKLVLVFNSSTYLDHENPENREYIDNFYTNEIHKTDVEIYDVMEDGSLNLFRTFSQDGRLSSSRLSGDYLYIVSAKPNTAVSNFKYTDIENYLPTAYDSCFPMDEEYRALPGDRIFIAPNGGESFVTLSAINIFDSNIETDSASLLSSSSYNEDVYCSGDNYYISSAAYNGQTTDISKFSLSDGKVSFIATGTIDGTVYGQFAFDEYEGFLRVASTLSANRQSMAWIMGIQSDMPWPEPENYLSILDSEMNVISKVGPLAIGETVQSARFVGPMAYIVTYRNTDPLFAIDVSDPYNPVVKGELKIPGFSTYMHPIDENTMLGLGIHTDENDPSIFGIKLSLFDVTDSENPRELSTLALEGNIYSIATDNHKAIRVVKDRGLVIIPVETYDNATIKINGVALEGNDLKESYNMIVFDISSRDEIKILSTLDHLAAVQSFDPSLIYHVAPTRSTYYNDTFITVSNQFVFTWNFNDFSHKGTQPLYLMDNNTLKEPAQESIKHHYP